VPLWWVNWTPTPAHSSIAIRNTRNGEWGSCKNGKWMGVLQGRVLALLNLRVICLSFGDGMLISCSNRPKSLLFSHHKRYRNRRIHELHSTERSEWMNKRHI
jgi:hypothetical protein